MKRLAVVVALAWMSSSCRLLPAEWRWVWTPGDSVEDVGYRPDQPIENFSHDLHANQMKIDCQYCHSAARRSIVAGVPPTNTCMGCHRWVATDRPGIKTLTEKYKANEPVEWVKVHDLPDFVRFSHMRHVAENGANLQCQDCHGPVENMTVAEMRAPLQMGWCVSCHQDRGARTDCFVCHY